MCPLRSKYPIEHSRCSTAGHARIERKAGEGVLTDTHENIAKFCGCQQNYANRSTLTPLLATLETVPSFFRKGLARVTVLLQKGFDDGRLVRLSAHASYVTRYYIPKHACDTLQGTCETFGAKSRGHYASFRAPIALIHVVNSSINTCFCLCFLHQQKLEDYSSRTKRFQQLPPGSKLLE